jgi:hypothetical protein
MAMRNILIAGFLCALVCNCGDGSHPVIPGGGKGGGLGETGGIGGTIDPTDPNVIAVVVDSGPQRIGYTNGLFASATVCEPGTTRCLTIDHLLVDTGSVGLRVLESKLTTLNLPAVQSVNGTPLAECTPFVDGTSWGPVKLVDLTMGGEMASNVAIQAIGELAYPIAADCSGNPITDFESLGANGILGVGIYLQDCGMACAQPVRSSANPGLYYTCSSNQAGGCMVAAVPVAQQLPHPVSLFPVDNNGVIIQLPGIAEAGVPSVSGLLIFGIGTQQNNGLGSATVLTPTNTTGYVNTTFPVGGTKYTSFIDSGSNGLFFLNEATTNLKQCAEGFSDFYCPTTTTHLSATISGGNGTGTNINFSVANASKLAGSAYAFSNLAGPMPGFPIDKTLPGFDWGLPFYFGRSVYTAIEQKDTPSGVGPFFAF